MHKKQLDALERDFGMEAVSGLVQMLRNALRDAQSNHHGQMLRARGEDKRNSTHYGNAWQKCPSTSCHRAAVAWEQSGGKRAMSLEAKVARIMKFKKFRDQMQLVP